MRRLLLMLILPVLILPVLILPVLILLAGLLAGGAGAGQIVDATGRRVAVPDRPARVLPAGPPAAVLLAALAPDLMLGWPMPLPPDRAALLAADAAARPPVPHLATAPAALAAIVALHPDLILDYGTVAPAYADTARLVQDRTGIPAVLLDGALADIPRVLRSLGAVLQRADRAEALARLAEQILAMPPPAGAPSVLYVRGGDDLTAAADGTGATEIFHRLGWHVLAPAGAGWFRSIDIAGIAALDPDELVFGTPELRAAVATQPAWQAVRAVRTLHVRFAPRLPFGWIEAPPSLNRLLGLAWLSGADPAALAAGAGADLYGRAPTPEQRAALAAAAAPFAP